MSQVEIISSCLVGIASNVSPSMSKLELTPWDLRLLLLNPIQRGILFHKPPQSHENIIHHLKNSLSRTLHFFPPLAGRLASTDESFVDCNNAGAEFVHAIAGAVSVADIMEPTCVPDELVSTFFPLNGVPNLEGFHKPLMGVQVTELKDGLFIGCAANHAIVDGISFWHFNSWSEISRGVDNLSRLPVFERWFPNNGGPFLPELPSQVQQKYVKPPLRKRIFLFSKETLAKLKAKANSEAETDKYQPCKRCLSYIRAQASCVDDTINHEVGFMMAIGSRGRIPLPEGYFGNAVYTAKTATKEAELLRKGLGHAALVINELVAQQTKERAIKFVEDWVKNPVFFAKGSLPFFITSSPHHDVYGNDFGWGKPIAVRSGMGTNFNGNMTTFPSAVAGGIEVHACLTPQVLQAMEKDTEFMKAFTLSPLNII